MRARGIDVTAGTGGPWDRLDTIAHARPSAAPKWQPFVSWSGSVLRGWGLARTLPAQGAQWGRSGLTGATVQAAGVLLPRPDGGCQKTDVTLTKDAVDGRLSSAAMAQTNIRVAFADYKHFTVLYSKTQKRDVRNVWLRPYTRAPEPFPEDAQKMQQLVPQVGLNRSQGALLPKSDSFPEKHSPVLPDGEVTGIKSPASQGPQTAPPHLHPTPGGPAAAPATWPTCRPLALCRHYKGRVSPLPPA
ncbi:uncharacterized protein [Pseudorca crassidens]|uniref:uncharacterized protein n=1 Tax=Pseudorca crassidens TaxID=82174 RepID=UPI00352BD2DE